MFRAVQDIDEAFSPPRVAGLTCPPRLADDRSNLVRAGGLLPSFAQDIRPLFRDKDVEEMQFAFDLSSYDDVKDNAQAIVDRIADGSMPCDIPWPEEQITLFRQWMDEGSPP